MIAIANPDEPDPNKKKLDARNYAGKKTPLAAQIKDSQAAWLIDHVSRRWERLHSDLFPWRTKMAKWEKQAEGDYTDRINQINEDAEDGRKGLPDVFNYLNESLGTTEGFVDFFTAQARDDIFGSKPWLTATPEGKADTGLAESITRHSSWKLGHSDLEEVLRDGIRIAAWGGTAFIKPRYRRQEEEVTRFVTAAYSKATGEPYRDATGEYITDLSGFPEDFTDGDDVEWREDVLVTDVVTACDNVCNACLDYNDVAFSNVAQKLELDHTDFYVRFRVGLLDLVAEYGIPMEEAESLRGLLDGSRESVREHRDETPGDEDWHDNNANPCVELVEGYLRCDVLENGKPVSIHCIFSPQLRTLFSIDYLHNVSPGGILPVFPLRIHKIANRILGIGYLEKYEAKNNSVDRKHNTVSLRARKSAHVWTAIQRDALKEPEQSEILLDPDTPLELAPDKRLADLLEFAAAPDMNEGLIRQRDAEMQMMQMQSGITSAAQGELKGVPSANTATGTNQIISRGATLLKDNIDPITKDITKAVEYNVHLIYANQDKDETFIWGEGKEAEIMSIKAGDVKGLRANVRLSLVRSQNQQKLESATSAINLLMQYVGVPEMEKPAARKLFIQALTSIGFRDAEDIIREGTIDPLGILALVPPEYQAQFQQAMILMGLIAPPEAAAAPGEEATDQTAPVTEAPNP